MIILQSGGGSHDSHMLIFFMNFW